MAAAANLQQQSRGVAKRFVAHSIASLRNIHISAYDKNQEDNVHATVVPDHVMPPHSDEYWTPHPRTGVFGPAKDDDPGLGRDSDVHANTNAKSVLEQDTFFRHQEDLDKPPVQP